MPNALEFPPWPCVYVISAGHRRYKIGRTLDMGRRFAALQHASPDRLRVVATRPGGSAEERYLHQRFANYRRHGEWFSLSPKNLRTLLALMDESLPMDQGHLIALRDQEAKAKVKRSRSAAGRRWNGTLPSTGQRAFSPVKRRYVDPTP